MTGRPLPLGHRCASSQIRLLRVHGQARANRVRNRRRRAAAGLDEDVPEIALDRGLLSVDELDRGAHRGLPQSSDRRSRLELVIEAHRREVADAGLRHDHVDARVDHRLVATELAPELGHGQVEIGQVVGVEDDALRVALVVADPQPMPEGLTHISYAFASSGSFLASISARFTITWHCFQVASSCILPSIMWTPAPSGIASITFLANSTSSGGGEKTFLAMSICTGCSDQAPTQPSRKAARNCVSQPSTSLMSPYGP